MGGELTPEQAEKLKTTYEAVVYRLIQQKEEEYKKLSIGRKMCRLIGGYSRYYYSKFFDRERYEEYQFLKQLRDQQKKK